jgi:23S rRNA pseudouridine955/2504/2580 synthase
VHRLDRDTSGVFVVARNHVVARKLSEAFSGRETDKIYLALVMGVPRVKKGEINLPLAKGDEEGRGREKMAVSNKGKSALTRYRVLDNVAREMSLVELMPLTGRTHQLRVHMASIGHPILGDGKYGGQQAFSEMVPDAKKLHLHAFRLDLSLKGKKMLEAPLPEHMADTMNTLGIEIK